MVDEHRELLAALQSRDPDRMLAVLERHIAVLSPPPPGKAASPKRRPGAKKGTA
jgi:DNA-binding GntR family transcriptional regulator